MRFLVFALWGLFLVGCGGSKSAVSNQSRIAEPVAEVERVLRKKREPKSNISELDLEKFKGEERVALLIGNNDYSDFVSLKNAVNDSRDMAKKLKSLGFKVVQVENGTRNEMNQKIKEFSEILKSSDGVGMLFYAGHGLEMGGNNYLIPVDANIDDKLDIKTESISLSDTLYRMEKAKTRLNIVVLDACRNNPFKDKSLTRKVLGENVGLASPPKAKGTYVAYSADIGEEAFDGEGKNGVFTKHLLASIDSEGTKLNDVFKITRKAVENETEGKQSPASYDKTTGDFYFKLPDDEDIIISQKDVRTDFKLQLNLSPKNAKVEFSDGKEFVNGDIYRGGRKSLKVFQKGYLTKFINIDLQKDSVLDVKLERVKKAETISKTGKLIWSGEDFKYSNLKNVESFEKAIEYYKKEVFKLEPKGEFEKSAEFKERKTEYENSVLKAKSDILNSWLGEQSISMKYSADLEEFDIYVNNWLIAFNFKLPVPRSEAKEFKDIENFHIFFDSNLLITGIEIVVSQGLFSKDITYTKKLNIDFAKAKAKAKYIAENTVSVGNLMFQDRNLPDKMNWQESVNYCQNLELLGFSDWRLPNRKELKTARNNRNSFKNLRSKTRWYWSISKYDSSSSWGVYFSDGNGFWGDPTYNGFVVCVRGL